MVLMVLMLGGLLSVDGVEDVDGVDGVKEGRGDTKFRGSGQFVLICSPLPLSGSPSSQNLLLVFTNWSSANATQDGCC